MKIFEDPVEAVAEVVARPTAFTQLNAAADKDRSTHVHTSKRIPSVLNDSEEHFMLDELCHCQIRL